MAKDYTKYSVEGVGENLSKSGLVKGKVELRKESGSLIRTL